MCEVNEVNVANEAIKNMHKERTRWNGAMQMHDRVAGRTDCDKLCDEIDL